MTDFEGPSEKEGLGSALTNTDGSLRIDKLAIHAKDDMTGAVQFVLMHHIRYREDGSRCMLFGAAARDIDAIVQLVGEMSARNKHP